MEKLLLRVTEAAEVMSISRAKAYELVASGQWKSVLIGRSRRIPVDDLRAWVEQHKLPAEDRTAPIYHPPNVQESAPVRRRRRTK